MLKSFTGKFPSYFCYSNNIVKFGFNLSDIDKTKYNWTSKVKIRKYDSDLHLYGIQSEEYIVNQQIKKELIPLCKSNLQKCIRRKEEDKAIRTMLAIYSIDPNELLRRLPIIMIEDCLPFPTMFTRLIWYMCAVSKGYKLSLNEIQWLLGTIVTLCESNSFKPYSSQSNDIKYENIPYDDLPNDLSNFLYALELREFYGGMVSDKKMLEYHRNYWLKNYKTKIWDTLCQQEEYSVDVASVGSINKSDILLESVDFHVYPWIIDKLSMYTDIDKQNVKKYIWLYRSSINKRVPITEIKKDNSGLDVYNKKIKQRLDSICYGILDKIDI